MSDDLKDALFMFDQQIRQTMLVQAELEQAELTIDKVRKFCEEADAFGDEIETKQVLELLEEK